MVTIQRPRATRRRSRTIVLAVLVVVAAVTGGCRSHEGLHSIALGAPPGQLHDDRDGVVGVADGMVPDGVTVFDDEYPAVTKLDPALLGALRRASRSAGDEFVVNSGWRSAAYQEQLLDEAVSTYGSSAEAARWVATPTTSPHVSGDAVDIGESHGTEWLADYGAQYGLCQIYRNEPWHYELRPEAADHGCPAMYDDPTHDPRMQE